MDKQFDYRGCKIIAHRTLKHSNYQGDYYSVSSYTIIYPDGEVEDLPETNIFASFLSIELYIDEKLKDKNTWHG